MRIKYQASFFADLSSLSATPQNIVQLMNGLNANGVGLLPSTIHEIIPPNLTPIPRLRFASPEGDAELVIGTGRFDVVKQSPSLNGENIGSFTDFCVFVDNCVTAIFQGRNITGSRLAFIVQTMSDELSVDQLNASFNALFVAPQFYAQHPPIEWTFRANTRQEMSFGLFNEPINTILKTERVQGRSAQPDVGWEEFDRIMSEYDINTLPENANPRFAPDVLRTFVDSASAIVSMLEDGLNSQL